MGPDNAKLLLLLLNIVIVRIKTPKEKVGYSLTLVAQTMMMALAKLAHYLKKSLDLAWEPSGAAGLGLETPLQCPFWPSP